MGKAESAAERRERKRLESDLRACALANDGEEARRLIGLGVRAVGREKGDPGEMLGTSSPLELAAANGSDWVLEALLELTGPAPEELANALVSAALSRESGRAAEMLLAAGAPPAGLASGGDPWLMALSSGSLDCARALAASGRELARDPLEGSRRRASPSPLLALAASDRRSERSLALVPDAAWEGEGAVEEAVAMALRRQREEEGDGSEFVFEEDIEAGLAFLDALIARGGRLTASGREAVEWAGAEALPLAGALLEAALIEEAIGAGAGAARAPRAGGRI